MLASCAGCNAILGLDQTHRAGSSVDAAAIDGAVDAHLYDANPDDLDGDGVPNASDDCPEAFDPFQGDEDADKVGDACDDCPEVANADQADQMEVAAGMTADGIGDACDPSPNVGGDRRALFIGFNDLSELVGWKTPVGTWSVSAGALHQGSGTAQNALAYYDKSISPTVVRVGATIDGVTSGLSGTAEAGVWLAMKPPPSPGDDLEPDGYQCLLVQSLPAVSTGEVIQVEQVNMNAVGHVAMTQTTHVMAAKDVVQFRAQVTPTAPQVRCADPSASSDAETVLTDTAYSAGAVGLRTHNVTMSVQWMVIYTR